MTGIHVDTERKILVLTYYWPPSGGAGVQRWLKMTKYLPEHGIVPVVVTVSPDQVEYPVLDESLCAEVDRRVRVYHTSCFNPYGFYRRFTGRRQSPYGGFANEGVPSFRQKVARFVRGNFFLPDARRGWNRYAFREALRLIDAEGIDTVVTTGPPMSTHLVGLRLKRRRRICWIADFRDPWTDLYYKDMLYPTRLARAVDAAMERRVLLAADHVTAATAEVKDLLKAKSPLLSEEHFSVITNGYDPADMTDIVVPDPEFTMVYTGTLAANYPLGTLLRCLEEMTADMPVHFRLVGKVDEVWAAKIREICGPRCTFVPYVPHRESIREVKRATVALLVLPAAAGYQGALPGKFFEYMGAGVPVLCLGSPDGAASRILAESGAGTGVAYDDADGIRRFLQKHYTSFLAGQRPVRPAAVENFDRDRIAERFSRLVADCRARCFGA